MAATELSPDELIRSRASLPCPRCGVERQVRSDRRNGPCRDCRGVLSTPELAMWVS